MHLRDREVVRFDDGLNIDLFYVCRGSIEITLIPKQTEVLKSKIKSDSFNSNEADTDEADLTTTNSLVSTKTITVKAKQYFDHLKR